MSDPLATIIAARLVIAAIDGGATLMGIMAEGKKLRPDGIDWPTALMGGISIEQPQDPQDAPTEPSDPT